MLVWRAGWRPVGRASAAQPAPVDRQYDAGYVIGSGRGEENDRPREVGRVSPAPGGDAVKNRGIPLPVISQGSGVVGGDISRSDAVDGHAIAGPLVRECPDHASDPRLRRRVADDIDAALEAQQ